jgi:hypothetical protein
MQPCDLSFSDYVLIALEKKLTYLKCTYTELVCYGCAARTRLFRLINTQNWKRLTVLRTSACLRVYLPDCCPNTSAFRTHVCLCANPAICLPLQYLPGRKMSAFLSRHLLPYNICLSARVFAKRKLRKLCKHCKL